MWEVSFERGQSRFHEQPRKRRLRLKSYICAESACVVFPAKKQERQ